MPHHLSFLIEMKEDIEFRKVHDIAVAVIPEDDFWKVYLLNLKNEAIQGIIVNSRGYGVIDGREVKTSNLKQLFDEIKPKDYVVIELINKELFGLHNEYWVSFWHNKFLYDKKYVFVPETLIPENLTPVPLLEKMGVMIK